MKAEARDLHDFILSTCVVLFFYIRRDSVNRKSHEYFFSSIQRPVCHLYCGCSLEMSNLRLDVYVIEFYESKEVRVKICRIYHCFNLC